MGIELQDRTRDAQRITLSAVVQLRQRRHHTNQRVFGQADGQTRFVAVQP